MTAPAPSWALLGIGADEAGELGALVPEQAPPAAGEAVPDPPVAVERPAAGPAERALLEASRELGALHPLDRLEQLEEQAVAAAPVEEPAAVEAVEVPWAVAPVLDVLPSGAGRSRAVRDLVLPAVLLAELLGGVWLGATRPWQDEAADPLQARFSSTAPVGGDLRLPGAPAVPGAVPLPASSFLVPSTSRAPQPSRSAARPADPFRPR